MVGIPIVVLLVIEGGAVYTGVVAGVAVVAAWEAFHLLRSRGHRPAMLVGLAMTSLLAVAPAMSRSLQWWQATVLVGLLVCGVWFLFTASSFEAFVDLALTIVVAVYAGGLLGSLVALRNLGDGLRLVLLVLILTWSFDTGAYLGGRTWGRRSFMARISKKKTWEGVVSGVIFTIAVALVAAVPCRVTLLTAFLVALVVATAAQAGDLVESLMKRYAQVKDSGKIIPGHGGVLDRIDSLLFSGTAAYFVLLALGVH